MHALVSDVRGVGMVSVPFLVGVVLVVLRPERVRRAVCVGRVLLTRMHLFLRHNPKRRRYKMSAVFNNVLLLMLILMVMLILLLISTHMRMNLRRYHSIKSVCIGVDRHCHRNTLFRHKHRP